MKKYFDKLLKGLNLFLLHTNESYKRKFLLVEAFKTIYLNIAEITINLDFPYFLSVIEKIFQ